MHWDRGTGGGGFSWEGWEGWCGGAVGKVEVDCKMQMKTGQLVSPKLMPKCSISTDTGAVFLQTHQSPQHGVLNESLDGISGW